MSLSITKFEGTVAIADRSYKFSCNGSGLIFDVDHTDAMNILNSFSNVSPADTIEAVVSEVHTTTTPIPEESEVTISAEPVIEEEEAPKPKKRGRKKKVPEVEAAKESSGEEPPDEIKNARQLKGIVSYFVDLGITDSIEITKQCEKYRESVPLLSRATGLEERVSRILVLIGVNDEE